MDILLTHGPPFGFGDTTAASQRVGCAELRQALAERAVSVSLAGHIHEGCAAGSAGEAGALASDRVRTSSAPDPVGVMQHASDSAAKID